MSYGHQHSMVRVSLIATIVLFMANLAAPSLVVHATGPVITATKQDSFPSHPSGAALPGDTINYTVTVSNSGSDATGVNFNDPLDLNTTYVPNSLESTPIARNDSYVATGNIRISVPATSGVLANDSDPDGDTLTITNPSGVTAQHGTLSLAGDGSFTYNPNAGFRGNDTFTYTVGDGHGHTDTAVATITVSGMLWFINNAASTNGDGRLTSPFNSLSAFNSINDGSGTHPAAGDGIFLYSGSGNYTGGVKLLNNQKLVGQGASYSLSAITGITPPQYSDTLPSTGGSKPVLSASGNNVTLGSGNTNEGLSLSSSGGTALSGTNFGTLTLRDITISNSSGAAIILSNGTLDAFVKSVSASGATNGIGLTNTAGSFTVTGDGSTAGSGGTIQNSTGAGILLNGASSINLSWMIIKNGSSNGIQGSNVAGFSLDHSTVSGNGNAVGQRALAFGDRASNITGLTGVASITNSTISNPAEDGVMIRNGAGSTLNLTVSNSSFTGTSAAVGNDGLLVMADDSANITMSVTGSTFSGNRGDQFQFTANSTATGTNNVTFSNNTLTDDRGSTFGGYTLGGGVTINPGGSGYTRVAISGNSINGAVDSAIKLNPGLASGGRLDASASSNTIGTAATADSGSAQADGILVWSTGSGTANALLTGNTVRQYANVGIYLLDGEGNATQNSTVTSNTVANPDPVNALNGIRAEAGTLSTDTSVLCADINGNSATGSGGTGLTDLRARLGSTANVAMKLPGYTGGSTDTTAVASYLSGRNGGATANASDSVSAPFQNGGTGCTQPTAPSSPTTGTLPTPQTPTAPSAASNTPSYTPPAPSVSTSGGTIALGIGLLPANKSVTLTYAVTINSSIAAANVSNQGTVSGTNFSNVVTNDPDTSTPNDATLTPISIPTTTAVSSSSNPAVAGNSITFTATVTVSVGTATPTGSVQFKDNGIALGSPQTVNGSGVATYSTSSLTPGIHTITAEYTGTGPFQNSTGTLSPNQEVDAAPAITTQPTDQAVTAGSSVSFTAAATGYPAPTVQWQVSTDGGGTWTDIPGATSTTYSFTAQSTDNGKEYRAVFTNTFGGSPHTATSNAATLTINVAPAITTNPTDQTVNAGDTVSFTAAASGNPAPTVQWQVSTDGGSTWTNIPGATSTTLSFTASLSQDGNKYRAVFTNSVGSATTTAATLNINAAPTVTTNPSNQTVAAGDTATFTAAASGKPAPSVQWQVSTDGGTTWNDITGATSTTLTLTSVTASMNGNQYRAVFTNSIGTATTSSATLTVQYAPSIITQPSDLTVNAGDTASFTVVATGNPTPSVQWQVSTDNGSTWSDIAGATSMTYSFTASAGQNGNQYRAVVSNTFGGSSHTATSNAATLTVNAVPSITTQPSDVTVNAGDTATFTAAASGTPAPSVQWQVSVDGGGTWTDIAGATSTTYTIAATTAAMNGNQYRAVFTNTFGGSAHTATSNPATLTVDFAPVVTSNPSNQTVNVGDTATFSAAANGNPAPSVQWQVSTDNGSTWSNIPGATSTTLSFSASLAQNGNQYRAVFANSVSSVASNAATLTVNAAPVVTTNPTDQTVAAGGTATFTAAASGTPSPTVQWQVSTDGGTTWSNISGATGTTLTLTNVTPAMDHSQYRAVFSNSIGTATTSAATLTVQFGPTIITQPSNQTVVAGATASFTVVATGEPTPTVQWQVSTDGGSTWNNIPGATSMTLSFTATLPQNGNEYRAVFTNSVGSVASQPATLTVNAAPTITTQPSNVTVNAGSPASFTAAASGNPTPSVQWQVSSDGGGTWTAISGATNTTYTIASTTAGQNGNEYRAVFTNSFGGTNHTTTSNAATLTVDFAPSVTSQPADQTVNAGDTATFTAAANGNPAPSVQWQVNTGSGWTDIPGATSTTLTVSNVTVGMDGNQYRAVFTNTVGSVTSSAATLHVGQITTTTVTSSQNPSVYHQAVTFTATVARQGAIGAPAGTVQFRIDGTTFGSPVALNGSGQAQSGSISTLTVGNHTITADYTPATGTHDKASNGALNGGQTVNKDATSTTLSPVSSPKTYGQSITFTATVAIVSPGSGTPTGTVTFYDGATALGTGTLNGSTPDVATFTTSSLGVGNHTITAVYTGDTTASGSPSSPIQILVQAATSTLYTGMQFLNVGTTLTVSAQVTSTPAVATCTNNTNTSSPAPAPYVTFTLDSNPTTGAPWSYTVASAVPVRSGTASLAGISTTSWLAGVYTLTATYTGPTGCLTSLDTAMLTVGTAGDAANGSGWYTLPTAGRVNFGFTIHTVPNTNPARYQGQITLINTGKWKLKGTLTSFTKTNTNQGAASGSGQLYWWNGSLNQGMGDWQAVSANPVTFTVSFSGSGPNAGGAYNTFGIHINYTPTPPQPSTLPNFVAQPLKGGNVTVR